MKTLDVAKALLGCCLIHKTPQGTTSGRIIETEAYLSDDPASHSFNGKTKRNEAMFGAPGKAYVYFTYGMHHCFNVVTNKEGVGEAVLIRALEPVSGIEIMKKRRKTDEISNLCSGPAKLVEAMGIKKAHNNCNLLSGSLKLSLGEKINQKQVVQTTRVGISKAKELPYRFVLAES